MKPYSEENNFFKLNKNQKPLWQNSLKAGRLRLFSRLLFFLTEFISLLTVARCEIVRVAREALVILHAYNQFLLKNKRFLVGAVFIGVLAPIAGSFYVKFSTDVLFPQWFYKNYYNLFLVLGPSLKQILVYLGLFIAFNRNKFSFILFLPLSEEIAKIIWVFQVKTNDEYQRFEYWQYIGFGIFIGLGLFTLTRLITWAVNHRELAFDKRIDGIFQVTDELPAEKVVSMLKTTWREKKEFQKQY